MSFINISLNFPLEYTINILISRFTKPLNYCVNIFLVYGFTLHWAVVTKGSYATSRAARNVFIFPIRRIFHCPTPSYFTILFLILYILYRKQVQGGGHERGREFLPSRQICWRSLWQFYAWNRIQSYVGNMSEGPAAEIGHRKRLAKEYYLIPRKREIVYEKF